MALEIEILPDAQAVAERGAEIVAASAAEAVAERGRFTLAVSGGRTPWAMFAALYGRMPWEKVTIFQVDERVAPDGDPERNLTQLLRSLPAGGAADVRAMPVGFHDLEAAAADYADSLPDVFDLVHLGLGPDGHTASLVPGDPVLDVSRPRRRAHRRVPGSAAYDADVPGAQPRAPDPLARDRRRQASTRSPAYARAIRRSQPAASRRRMRASSPTRQRQDLRHERIANASTRSSRGRRGSSRSTSEAPT